MQRVILVAIVLGLTVFNPMPALAQAEAQAAYQQARAAYEAGKFAEARDLAKKASQTDPKNPEIFLLLGKAHYQLGEQDEAVAAWNQTLALAPKEPFAARMLETLRGQRAGVDARIGLVEVLIQEKLHTAALEQCKNLLADRALTEVQRARALLLQADTLIRTSQPPEALKVLQELAVLYPRQADPIQLTLLTGQAKLRSGGAIADEGVALLRKFSTDHPKTPAAATAQLELILFYLGQAVDTSRVESLEKWLADNPKHARTAEARRTLLSSLLALTRQGPHGEPKGELAATDVRALTLAGEILKDAVRAEEAEQVSRQLLDHLENHYGKHGANAAATGATATLLKIPLPRSSRLLVVKASASYQSALALNWIREEALAGRLPATAPEGALPKMLADAVAAFQGARTENPDQPLWAEQMGLVAEVRQQASRVSWPSPVTGLRSPDAWALAILWPVLEADGDKGVVKQGADLVQAIIADYLGQEGRPARELAVGVSRRLLAATTRNEAVWADAATRHAKLLDTFALFLLNENVRTGNDALNAKISDPQKELISTLQRHVARDAAYAPATLKVIEQHVQPWTARGHWALAEDLYTTLAKGLPEEARWTAELKVVQLWVAQVKQEHQRLTVAGLSVPRPLDARLQKALLRTYELQAGRQPTDPRVVQARAVWEEVVSHYKTLDFDDVAEAAIKLKPEQAIPAADEFAAYQLVVLQEERARREATRLWSRYGASEKIALTPAFRGVLDAWLKFLAEHPAGPLALPAAERVLGIAAFFEQHAAPNVAAGVYAELAKAAAGLKVLAQGAPGIASLANRAAYLRAAALDAFARKGLAKVVAQRKSDTPPPAQLSEDFAAAIAAYTEFAEAHPDSPLAVEATSKVMAVALDYTRLDAWDVADSVFADLLKSKLKVRRPERLEFARGLAQLGRAMPDHARQVLQALTSAGLRGSEEGGGGTTPAKPATRMPSAPGMPAGGSAGGGPPLPPTNGGIRGMGGMGGMGMGSGMGQGGFPGGPGMSPPGNRPSAATGLEGVIPPADPRAANEDETKRDAQVLSAIRQQEAQRATQVAQLREQNLYAFANQPPGQSPVGVNQPPGVNQDVGRTGTVMAVPVLSDAELARQDKALAAAYAIFQAIRKNHPNTPTAEQARGEILVMVGHWRGLTHWSRSATLGERFLTDNPADPELPRLRLEIARDRLAWAAKPVEGKLTKQALLTEVGNRFRTARAELARVVADFPAEKTYQQEAQWEIATSFLTEARVVATVSPTLARGQYVRAARELRQVAEKYAGHPRLGTIPQMLWDIAAELTARGFDEEAILAWNELTIHDPMNALAKEAGMKIAQTYHQKLKRPLKAAEAYQELNFIRGGTDAALQNAIFQIGTELKNEKRWVEALHVLEAFVDSFPRHPQAGQALTIVGQIHQANEAWQDAIAAYKRVIGEFRDGQWVHEAKWAIAECTINLSRWDEATQAYRDYVAAYPQDPKLAEANRRIEVLKDLARYQGLVDEKGQRKSFDAQYQIAVIVRQQLANPVKAIIEFRKVAERWPESHLADDALHEVGATYLSQGDNKKAREALVLVADKYPSSPLADDALFLVGKSYEEEADKLGSLTREKTVEQAKEQAQRAAYDQVQEGRRQNRDMARGKISGLKAAGQGKAAELEEASQAAGFNTFNDANVKLFAQQAEQKVEELTATQLADRQDKINAALRKAVESYTSASKVPGADKAGDALLQMATIFDKRLKDSKAALETWLEIVRQFSGTAVAEDASWKIAQFYDRDGKHAQAVDAYNNFLRNYRRSPNAGAAQFAVAENYERLGQWVAAMDAYSKYITNFADGPLVNKAKEQINWIKTYRL